MSYTDKVKHELTRLEPGGEEEQLAELAALVRMGGSIEITDKKLAVRIRLHHGDLARKYYSLFKNRFNFSTEIVVKEDHYFSRHHIYELFLPPQEGVEEFLQELGFMDGDYRLIFTIKDKFKRVERYRRGYLRGAFLGGGSVNSPQSEYHLELRCEHRSHAEDLVLLLTHYELEARVNDHKGKYVVYLKSAEDIAIMLNVIGAHQALLEIEEVQVMREVKNSVNRKVNCETANLEKTVAAAMGHLEDIEFVERMRGLDTLSASLQEIARLRRENPYASLKELGKMLDPPLSKSGVNHRLRRIRKIAREIRSDR
ncbi:MAG: DNA-binding protein WhiA [Bacillota bacterium]